MILNHELGQNTSNWTIFDYNPAVLMGKTQEHRSGNLLNGQVLVDEFYTIQEDKHASRYI
jgi:hypothetical protein